uniref:TYR_PHOSPHATASE_2 domain-containing protein n=1 Tax=Wuchereria bancrofti TaxID=6293 RepID=A0A1I8EQU6_WUCBA
MNKMIDILLISVIIVDQMDVYHSLPWGKQNTLAKAANTLLKIFLMVSDDKTLIHCHAGGDRTGVLLALDFAVHQLKNLQTVNVEVNEINLSKNGI